MDKVHLSPQGRAIIIPKSNIVLEPGWAVVVIDGKEVARTKVPALLNGETLTVDSITITPSSC